jgi:hypothetical protein
VGRLLACTRVILLRTHPSGAPVARSNARRVLHTQALGAPVALLLHAQALGAPVAHSSGRRRVLHTPQRSCCTLSAPVAHSVPLLHTQRSCGTGAAPHSGPELRLQILRQKRTLSRGLQLEDFLTCMVDLRGQPEDVVLQLSLLHLRLGCLLQLTKKLDLHML